MARWEHNGWRTASGKRVRHADVWKRILKWLRLFESSQNRCVEVFHVKAHSGKGGNECADKLAKRGAKLRGKLMLESTPDKWFEKALKIYWDNRRGS